MFAFYKTTTTTTSLKTNHQMFYIYYLYSAKMTDKYYKKLEEVNEHKQKNPKTGMENSNTRRSEYSKRSETLTLNLRLANFVPPF